jgi:hypothetical protein
MAGRVNERVPITEDIKSAFLRDTLEMWPTADRARIELAFRQMMVHEYLPVLSDMRVDDAGYVWLRKRGATGPASHWDIFSTTGAFYARVELPPHRAILDLADGHVVLLETGQFGEDLVSVYSLNRQTRK